MATIIRSTHYRTARLLAGPLLAAVALGTSGCSAFTSTTNVAADAAETVAHGISKASRATSDASVTEPDTPRYAQAVAFVASQRDPLAREAAAGGGEHVDALARLLDGAGRAPLGPWLQANYARIFTDNHDAAAVVDAINARRGRG